MIEPRGWQKDALDLFGAHRGLSFLLEATPGAGKTIFSGICAQQMLSNGAVDFVLVVVPTTALKGDATAGFLGDWHKVGVELTTVLKDGRGVPRDFHGAVITYSQLPNIVSTIETWVANGVKLLVTFDEGHHTSEDNRWGAAAEAIGRCAVKVLVMTGTPFRGDRRRISFVKYNNEGVAISDYAYTYREAVRDKVCRPVCFMPDDGVAQYVLDEQDREVRISEAKDFEAGHASSVIFAKESEWLAAVINKADAKLDEYRITDADAGGLIICRPGTDESDDRHLHQVAKLVLKITGERPEVITHEDSDANAKIERFRKGTTKWLCSVRKVSEGVDIKRLRVEVIANRPTTELLFRQLVGRVVRVDNPRVPGDATIYMAKFPQLVEWAARIAEEADAGLRDQPGLEEIERDRLDERQRSNFVPIASTHEDGGAISDFGEAYTAAEVGAADNIRRNDPQLSNVPVVTIAHILRRLNYKPEVEEAVGEPLYKEKLKLRASINRLARQIAYEIDPDKPAFADVWKAIHAHLGVRSMDDLMDNHGIDTMRQAEALLKGRVGGRNHAA